MSEDSIASESLSLSHRAMEPGAEASLPPRKRLLAGFKQSGWSSASSSPPLPPLYSSSFSSSSSSSSPSPPPIIHTKDSSKHQIKSHLDRLSAEKHEDLGQSSGDARIGNGEANGNADGDNASEKHDGTSDEEGIGRENGGGKGDGEAEALEEGAVSDCRIILRKSKRFCVERSASKRPKRMKKSLTKDVKNNSLGEKDPPKKALCEKEEAVTVEISVHMALLSEERAPDNDTVSLAKSSEEEEEEEDDDDDDDYNDDNVQPNAKHKQAKVITDESLKLEKVKEEEEESLTAAYGIGTKPRRNPSRQNHSKSKDLCKKQEAHIEKSLKSSHVTPSLSDEELARELHRAMNSSPRISRCLNYKDGPLLSLNR